MKGIKYNLHFQDRTGNELSFNELKMSELQNKLESLLQENYNINDRISNQTIYNLQKRPEHVSRFLRTFVRVEKLKKVL